MIGAALKSHFWLYRHSLLVWPPGFSAASIHMALQQISSSELQALI
jgi:hypothetical protein